MNIYEIVMKLIGPVQPTGHHYQDIENSNNMQKLIDLTEQLIFEISLSTVFAEKRKTSVKKIGVQAQDFFKRLKIDQC